MGKTSTATLEDRYNAALTDVKLNSDVLVFDNYPSCCGSCADHEIQQDHPNADYVYFMNEQGRGLMWVDGVAWHFEEPEDKKKYRLADKIYFNHSTVEAATVLRDAFVKFGVPVDWDGTDGKCMAAVVGTK
jgi:hypothetical protein